MEKYRAQKTPASGSVRPPQVVVYSNTHFLRLIISFALTVFLLTYRLVTEEYEPANLRVHITSDQDGVYKDEVLALSGHGEMKPTLLLIAKRLGHDSINPLYYNSLKVYTPIPHIIFLPFKTNSA
jgi:Peptidase family C54